jgi:hypothetical protein
VPHAVLSACVLRFAPVRSPGFGMPCRERAVELVTGREPGTHRLNWACLCAPRPRLRSSELSSRQSAVQRGLPAWAAAGLDGSTATWMVNGVMTGIKINWFRLREPACAMWGLRR